MYIVTERDYLSIPDAHLEPDVAEAYDGTHWARFSAEELDSIPAQNS